MARSIKHYNGFYNAQTSAYYDNASTGYTVPTGKVARIGISFSSYGGSSGSRGVGGFYAGGSSAAATNRFLVLWYPTTTGGNQSNGNCNLFYHANTGHYWHTGKRDYNPKLWLMDGHICERSTDRTDTAWAYNNFENVSTIGTHFGALRADEDQSTTTTSGTFPMFPAKGFDNYPGTSTKYGEVHAFAGETIYLFDYAQGTSYNAINYRPMSMTAWNLFIIEEDAG